MPRYFAKLLEKDIDELYVAIKRIKYISKLSLSNFFIGTLFSMSQNMRR